DCNRNCNQSPARLTLWAMSGVTCAFVLVCIGSGRLCWLVLRICSDPDHPEPFPDAALAGYIAKYATKSTGAVDSGEGPDRPIRDAEHIPYLAVSPHPPPMTQ